MMPCAETSRPVVNFRCFFGAAVGVDDFLEAFWLGREQDYPGAISSTSLATATEPGPAVHASPGAQLHRGPSA